MNLRTLFRIHNNVIVLFVIMVILAVGEVRAVTYYVDTQGNDTSGNGSASKPWATLSRACSGVKIPGDAIFINAGTYNDSAQCVLAPGINVQGAGKDQTIIKSSLDDWYVNAQSDLFVNGDQTISGFTLDGNNRTLAHGISIFGRHRVTVDNVNFIRIRDKALKLQGYDWWDNADQQWPPVPPPGYATGCVVSNVTITGCSESIPMASLWVQSLEDCLFDNIVIDESAGTGGQGNAFKSWPGWMRRCTIRNSTFTVNPTLSMDAITIELFNLGEDNEIYNSTFNEGYISLVQGQGSNSTWNLKFHDNGLINTVPLGYAHEIAVDHIDFYNNYITVQSLGVWACKYTLSDILIRNNVIYNTKGQGIVILNICPTSLDNVEVYNNVIDTTYDDSKAGIMVGLAYPGSITNLKIRNNVVMNHDYGVRFADWAGYIKGIASPLVTHNDLYNVKIGVENEGVTTPTISNNLSVSPQFSAMGARSAAYYSLLPTSSLVDAGVNVGLPFSGSVPDIGAFEAR